jgi:hypothetical protein
MMVKYDPCTCCYPRLHQLYQLIRTAYLLSHASAIGSYQFYAITFRKQEQEQMLLVTDRMGRVRHATQSLAQLLDTTVERLQVNLSRNASERT